MYVLLFSPNNEINCQFEIAKRVKCSRTSLHPWHVGFSSAVIDTPLSVSMILICRKKNTNDISI